MAKVAALALLIVVGAALPVEWLRYDREAVVHGQVWRLLSCHLAHDGLLHLAQNVATLLALGVFFHDKAVRPAVVLASALAVSLGILVFCPDVPYYVGFSGALHGCAAGTLNPYALGIVGLKVIYELVFGPTPLAGDSVLVVAHLYGAAGGLAAGLALRRFRAPAEDPR
ncbi:MAG: rhombosortase [Planctomycetota bacterium]